MKLGTVFTSLVGGPPGPSRPFGQWIGEAEELLSTQEKAGFSFTALTHAYQSSAGGGMQPMVLASRLAPISGSQRLAMQVLLLPLLNALDVAYNVATLDHITEGRLDVGIGLGYHPKELEAMGISRSDRVPKFEEAVGLMRELWRGRPVYHRGRYFHTSGNQLTLLPVQSPHPPLWGSCQSHGAAARAGRLLDGIVVAPQVTFRDLRALLDTFREEWLKCHTEDPPLVGAWRTIIVGKDPKDAIEKAIASGRQYVKRYHEGTMQERTMVKIPMELRGADAADWAILGSYAECLEGLRRCRDELNLSHVTCQFYNLPEDLEARLEWLNGFGEEVVQNL